MKRSRAGRALGGPLQSSQLNPRRGMGTVEGRIWFYKILWWSLSALLLALLETAFFARLSALAFHPDLILALVVCVALRGGEKDGMAVGVLAGFLSDAVAGTLWSLSPLFGFAAGLLCGYFGRGFFRRRWMNFAVWLAILAAGKQLLLFFARLFAALSGRAAISPFGSPLRRFCFDLAGTLLLSWLVFGVFTLIERRGAGRTSLR